MDGRSFLSRAAPVLVLFGGVAAFFLLSSMQDDAETSRPADSALAVEAVAVEARSIQRIVQARGTVAPAQQVQIRPQVSGRVVEVSEHLQPGAIVKPDAVLLKIESTDYELGVSAAQAEVRRAEAELALEKGRRKVAEAEWQLFENDLADVDTSRALATREPQLAAAMAAMAMAKSRLATAQLNLSRTEISAPFSATVLSEQVSVGQTVGPESAVAEVAGTEAYWIRISLPLSDLAHVVVGAEATVILEATDYRTQRPGRVVQVLSQLEPNSRLAGAIVEVAEPLGTDLGPPLLLGSYVLVSVVAPQSQSVVELPEAYLRGDDAVLLYGADDALEIRSVNVGWRNAEFAYISKGLETGDRVITTRLGTAVKGQPLSLRNGAAAPEAP